MAAIDDLLEYVFDGRRPQLYGEFEHWLRESRRFQAFAHEYRSKIRAKVRNAGNGERMDDLRAELETGALLLKERSFALEYEKYAALNQRGPDFTVTYKTHTPFNVEVRRLRDIAADASDPQTLNKKLMAVLCEKVRQMPPSVINLLWLSSDAKISIGELAAAVRTLRRLVDDKPDEVLRRCRLRDRSDFYKHYLRLSGVILPRKGGNVVWLNRMARHKAPRRLVSALRRVATNKA